MDKKIGIYLIWIFLLTACQQREQEILPGETIIKFRTEGVSPTIQSKSGTSNIPQGRTVRVVIYRSEEGATTPDLTDRKFVTSNTYEVLADGSLKPCIVDDQGNKIAGEAFEVQVPVYDGNTIYLDCYAYSPALPLKIDNQTVTVTHNIDFMSTAKYGIPVTQSATSHVVALPPMQRLCCALYFNSIYNTDNVSLEVQVGKEYPSNRKLGVCIENLYASGTYTLGTNDIVLPTDNQVSTIDFPDYVFTNPSGPLVTTKLIGEIYVLPGAADNTKAKNEFSLKIDMNFSVTSPALTASARVVSFPASDGALILKKGYRTTYNMLVAYIGPGTSNLLIYAETATNTSPIVAWEDGGELTL